MRFTNRGLWRENWLMKFSLETRALFMVFVLLKKGTFFSQIEIKKVRIYHMIQ